MIGSHWVFLLNGSQSVEGNREKLATALGALVSGGGAGCADAFDDCLVTVAPGSLLTDRRRPQSEGFSPAPDLVVFGLSSSLMGL